MDNTRNTRARRREDFLSLPCRTLPRTVPCFPRTVSADIGNSGARRTTRRNRSSIYYYPFSPLLRHRPVPKTQTSPMWLFYHIMKRNKYGPSRGIATGYTCKFRNSRPARSACARPISPGPRSALSARAQPSQPVLSPLSLCPPDAIVPRFLPRAPRNSAFA